MKEKKREFQINKISMPKGGGSFQGLGEEMEVNAFTGECLFRLPLFVSPCRGAEPKLLLEYRSTNGNGAFGLGFSLNLPFVSRQTAKRIPQYNDSKDTFMTSAGELVLSGVDEKEEGRKTTDYVQRYEQDFKRIEYIKEKESSYWKITDKNNAVSLFGINENSIVVVPDNKTHVFCWQICETVDEKGNKILYSYNENQQIQKIQYGNYFGENGEEKWAFSIVFQYEAGRKDSFLRFNSGFQREFSTLCTEVLMIHEMEGAPEVVRSTRFYYDNTQLISLLQKISVTGYRRNCEGVTECMSLPDVTFSYTEFCPQNGRYHELHAGEQLPSVLQGKSYMLMDFYGEGIKGLLYSDETVCAYCRPLGNYRYDTPLILNEFPIPKDASGKKVSFTSLNGNGSYDLVVRSPGLNGFYPLENGKFGGFSSFSQIGNERNNAETEYADLQGDRLSHMLTAKKGELVYYPSLKKKGEDAPVIRKLPGNFPSITENSAEEKVCFLNLFGDGLAHRTKIKNGYVECFPNLGYGRFGEKIVLKNAPFFPEGLDTSRLFFADIDGSGTVDFIYIYPDRVDIFQNVNGTSFLPPFSIPLPEKYAKGDDISFGDITGSGSQCMIYTKNSIGGRQYCYDFTCMVKPYMLSKINTNSGTRTEIEYASSVFMYLEDREKGKPWQLKPPFPIQVVKVWREIDEISGSSRETRYHYQDGLYDYEENVFRGFGVIERSIINENSVIDCHMEDSCEKEWFYTGIDYSKEYNKDDSQAIELKVSSNQDLSNQETQKSLYGKILRKEVYGRGGKTPEQVEESSYQVIEVAAPEHDKKGAYYVYQEQLIQYRYEKDITDPVVHHQFQLDVDDYGNVIRACELFYPRRKSVLPQQERLEEQQKLIVIERVSAYKNQTGRIRHLGIEIEQKEYEVGGIEADGYFSLETLRTELVEAEKEILEYGISFTEGQKQKRLQKCIRSFYWNEIQTEVLPFGQVSQRVLLHHTEEAVFPEDFSVVTKYLSGDEVSSCGYRREDGYWWNVSLVNYYYGTSLFFLLSSQEDTTVFCKTCVSYDPYALLPIEVIEYIDTKTKNQKIAEIDYQALSYKQITDENENISQVIFNPLGQVMVLTSFGITEGVLEGDQNIDQYVSQETSFDKIIDSPAKYLQGMSSFYFYDFLAYQNRGQPICTISLKREKPVSMGADSQIFCSVIYVDDKGNALEERKKIEGSRWAVTGRMRYNGVGKIILKYPPYESAQSKYAEVPEDVLPERFYYDWMQRIIRKELPDTGIAEGNAGYYYSTINYGSWEKKNCNEDYTLKDSEYYKAFISSYPENPSQEQSDRMNALQRVAEMDSVEEVYVYDNRGNEIAEILKEQDKYVQYWFDSKNNMIAMADGRLGGENKKNLLCIPDMQGRKLYTKSCDAGEALQLQNVRNQQVHLFDGNKTHKIISYDGLGRLIEVRVEGIGITSRVIYGEQAERGQERNLRGHPYLTYDQAGVESIESYNWQGLVQKKVRQLCQQYDKEINWSQKVPLEEKQYRQAYIYNSAGKVLIHLLPDKSQYHYSYYQSGKVKSVTRVQGEIVSKIVEQIQYNAAGKRTGLLYGNGVYRKFFYNSANSRLEAVKAVKQDGTLLEYKKYFYAPAGNILRIRDCLTKSVICHQQVTEPVWDYWYDSYGRLIRATGRENGGHPNDLEDIVAYQQDFTYDLGGNMTCLRHSSAAKEFTVNMEIAADANRLSTMSNTNNSDRNAHVIEYDGCGNTRSLPNLHRMDWNSDGCLTRAVVIERETGNNDEEFYTYDRNGSRVRKVTRRKLGNNTMEQIEKIYLGTYCIKKEAGRENQEQQSRMEVKVEDVCISEVIQNVTDGKLGIGNEQSTVTIVSQLEDHLGSDGIRLNENAKVISREEYYPYGGTALEWEDASGIPKEYGFCGKEMDRATGLHYFEARYYASYMGRMISPDELKYTNQKDWQTYNLYLYCRGNPVTYQDMDGHNWKIVLGIVSIVGVVITFGIKTIRNEIKKGDAAAIQKLRDMETAGGHTIARHTGKTQAELIARARTDKVNATSFSDIKTAALAYQYAVKTNAANISTWLGNPTSGNRLTLTTNHLGSLGMGVDRNGANRRNGLNQSVAVLEKSRTVPGGYRLVTIYPRYV